MERTNLIGRSHRYEERLLEGALPSSLEHLRNSIDWPILLDTPNLHIAAYFGEADYGTRDPADIHRGIDLQVPPGTPILCPERAEVIYLDTVDPRGVYSLYLWGEKSKVAYIICHLKPGSSPREFWKRASCYPKGKIILDEGDFLGKVGTWPIKLKNDLWIPEDAESVYGRNYDHLHFGVSYQPDGFLSKDKFHMEEFNPLLLLKRI